MRRKFLVKFSKNPNKFHDNPSSGSRVPCIQTGMTKVVVAFRSFADPPGIAYGFHDVPKRGN